MRLKFKNNFLGYFLFYYSVIGNKILVNLCLGVGVSFLDGIGLAMFMPLLQAAGNSKTKASGQGLLFLVNGLNKLGISLTITNVLIMLVVIFCVKGVLKFIQLTYQVNIRHLFIKRVRYSLVNQLQGLSYQGFLKLDAGRIQNTLTTEVQRLFQGMNYYFNATQSVVMLLTYIVLAVMANYQFALLVAVGATLSNFIYRKIYIITKKASLELSKKSSDFNGFLIQAIHNFKYLKSTNYFTRFSGKLKTVVDDSEAVNRKMGFYSAITTGAREPMIIIIVAVVIYIQLHFLGGGLPAILLSLLFFYRSLTFLIVIQNYWQNFIQNIGAMQAIADINEEMMGMQEVNEAVLFTSFNDNIRIKNATFSYGDKKVLEGIDINIPKNKTIALIGESGSGKTTLANMIAGLIVPDEGGLFIDNTNLSNYNVGSYRNKLGYIAQEPVIFSDHIFNNITFWAEPTEENKKRFDEIIELASLKEFIEGLQDKEFTQLGDNGILISGGQKQRISIARELYKNAEILILDEATSALDSETEKNIQENIEKLHGSYTMIIIAHRLSTIKDCDNIYLLERGKVLASGSFSEMFDSSEKFKRMVTLQDF